MASSPGQPLGAAVLAGPGGAASPGESAQVPPAASEGQKAGSQVAGQLPEAAAGSSLSVKQSHGGDELQPDGLTRGRSKRSATAQKGSMRMVSGLFSRVFSGKSGDSHWSSKWDESDEEEEEESPAHKQEEICPPVSYSKLLSTADGRDWLFMFLGVICAMGNGLLLPLFSIVFGRFTDAFGDPSTVDFMAVVSEVALEFLYLALGAYVASMGMTTFFMLSGNRQTNRLRSKYLEAVLKQEIAFFDVHATTGGLLQGLNEDSLAVQDAISEKCASFISHCTTFITGFLIGFSKGWDMTLVMLALLPFLALIGALLAKFVTSMEGQSTAAYTKASSIAQQCISQVRTVAAYNQEDRMQQVYSTALEKPMRVGIQQGAMAGLSFGAIQFIMYCAYAVGLFYGAHRIASGHYTGGQVLSVVIATLLGGFSLGQAAPNLQSFAKGRAGGARIFKVIGREPTIRDSLPKGQCGSAEDADGANRVSCSSGAGSSSGGGAGGKQDSLKHHLCHNATVAPASPQRGANTWKSPQPVAEGTAEEAGKPSTGPTNGQSEHGLGGVNKGSGLAGVVEDGLDPDAAGVETLPTTTSITVAAPPLPPLAFGTGELTQVRGEVELRNVTFAYPARPELPIFKNFNLQVQAGKTVALVGSSGSGKSTVVQLVERFYDPSEGMVLLDGVDIRALKLQWLRSQVGLVSQEPTLFATTIFQNISIGRPGATEEDVKAAAAAANATGFIERLPLGYETNVGERGLQLSGGQKQRIAIARAILKNPKVLLLDEATSALDTASERVVQAALDRMVVGRTTMVVAHRLSTIENADQIAVVQNGAIVELGSHDQLLQNPAGAYATLVKLQISKEAAEEKALVLAEPEAKAEGQVEDVDTIKFVARPASAEPKHKEHKFLGRHSATGDVEAATSGEHVMRDKRGSVDTRQSLEKKASHELAPHSGPLHKDSLQLETAAAADEGEVLSEAEKERREKEAAEARARDVSFKRLMALNKPEWPWLVVGCVSASIAGLQHPAFAFVIASMVNIFYTTDMDYLKAQASFYALMFLTVAIATLISMALSGYSFGLLGQHLARRVREQLFGAILKQEVGFFDREENNSGKLCSWLSTDAAHVRGAVGDVLGVALQNIATLAGGYVIGFIYDWRMALLITGCFPLIAFASFLQMKFYTNNSSAADKTYASANQAITEAFSSIRVIQAYNLQGFITDMYQTMLSKADKDMVKHAIISGLGLGYGFFAMFAMYGLVVWFGGLEIDRGWITFDDMFKAFIAVLLAAMGLAQSGLAFPDIGKAKAAVGRVFPVIDRQPQIDSSDPGGEKPEQTGVRGEIEFRDITFVYPSRPSIIVLRNFTLHCAAGKVTALVGESGSGKSTVVGLLERFYDPVHGEVFLDGINVRNFNVKWLRQQMALVSQEPLLFTGTVLDNIRFGRPGAGLEEVEAAAATANARDFIAKLPEGYNTRVGEGGIQLSGGQKQRIAIARAVIKNPKVLLLDEATSALDARSEKVVQLALDRVMMGRTSIAIAHRLTTIRHANNICVVHRGVVLEQGTHEALMDLPNGAYARLVANQAHAPSQDKKAAKKAAAARAAASGAAPAGPAAQ